MTPPHLPYPSSSRLSRELIVEDFRPTGPNQIEIYRITRLHQIDREEDRDIEVGCGRTTHDG